MLKWSCNYVPLTKIQHQIFLSLISSRRCDYGHWRIYGCTVVPVRGFSVMFAINSLRFCIQLVWQLSIFEYRGFKYWLKINMLILAHSAERYYRYCSSFLSVKNYYYCHNRYLAASRKLADIAWHTCSRAFLFQVTFSVLRTFRHHRHSQLVVFVHHVRYPSFAVTDSLGSLTCSIAKL